MPAQTIEPPLNLMDPASLEDTVVDARPVHPTTTKRPRKIWSLVALVFGLTAGIGVGWWLAHNQAEQTKKISLGTIPTSPANSAETKVTAAHVVYRNHQRFVDAVGSVNGYEAVTLSARTDGRVQSIHHDLAEQVKSGELLMKIDPTDAQLAVVQAKRVLDAEMSKWGFTSVPAEGEDLSNLPTVRSAFLKSDLARIQLNRMLSVQNANVVSQDDLDEAKSQAQVAAAEWNNQRLLAESSAATVRLRESELQIAQQKLNETEVYVPKPTLVASPQDNFYTISERLVSEGMLVRNGDPLFKLILGRTVKVRLKLHEAHSNSIAVDQTVQIETSSLDTPVIGKVVRISPIVDTETRTFQVEAEVSNEDMRLKPGSFVKAKILVGKDTRIVTIPITGLDTFAGVNKIFTLENGVAHEVKVKLGYQGKDWIEITEPKLPENAIIATSAQRLLSEGSAIAIRDDSAAGSTQTQIRQANRTETEKL